MCVFFECVIGNIFFCGNLSDENVEFLVNGNFCQLENCSQGELNKMNVLTMEWECRESVLLNVPLGMNRNEDDN